VSAPGEELRGILLPLGPADLLLPNAAVAEVLGYRDPESVAGGPSWLLGRVAWRERSVPLVSLPAAGEPPQPVARGPRARLAVIYTPNGNAAMPYLGLLCVGPPRLARFRADNLLPADPEGENPFVLHTLTHADRPGWIPDLDALELALLEALAP
jgi:chemosensory pili system protein ChpC